MGMGVTERCHPLHRDYHRLLFATIEHARWLAELSEQIETNTFPGGYECRCKLKTFFDASTDHAADMLALRSLHDALHAEVSRVLARLAEGAPAGPLQTLQSRLEAFLTATETVLAARSTPAST